MKVVKTFKSQNEQCRIMMKKVLLVYLPFCTPATPPYSITYLHSFLEANSGNKIEFLDLNLEFHKAKFPEYQKYYQNIKNWSDYEQKTKDFRQLTNKVYTENNRKVVNGQKPEMFEELLQKIKDKTPDVVAFSIVYSSQAFYAHAIITELKKLGITTVIGGPSVNQILESAADKYLANEVELLEFVNDGKKGNINSELIPDFSIYNLNEYFTPMPVIPIKTSSSCYYKQCTFCTHFSNTKYCEYPIEIIKKTVVQSKQKYFFLIDDMIHAKRLLELASVFKPLNLNWTCQLKPTKEFDYETLKKLRESGLTMIQWGIESGNDRILKLMNKGTNVKEIDQVLSDSYKAGIKNVAYIIFGFPTETKEEFLDTIEFLKRNELHVDLVSTSIFGLHKGTVVYNHPAEFGISKIVEETRTVLEPKITYEVANGLTQEQARKLRAKYKKSLNNINKYPKTMNFFREHMLCLI
jgi:radical SAM superfamily enzyme YgiQ (UPF0313 family)